MKLLHASIVAILATIAAPHRAHAADPPREQLVRVLVGLASSSASERAEAATAAGALHHPLFVDPLRALAADPAVELVVRVAAVRALGELGIPATSADLGSITTTLLTSVRDREAEVAVAAVRAVLRYPFPEVRTRLAALVGTPSTVAVVRDAIRAGLAAPDVAEARARVDAWLALSRDEALSVGQAATLDPSVTAPSVRWRVAADDPLRAARDLLDPSVGERAQVVAALAAAREVEEVVPFLARALREPAAEARAHAVRGLARSAQPAAEALLLAAHDDADPAVRRVVVDLVSARVADRPELVPSLFTWLERETTPAVREAVLGALGRAPRASVLDVLMAAPRPVRDTSIRDARALLAAQPGPVLPALWVRWMVDTEDEALAIELRAELAGTAEAGEAELVPLLLAEHQSAGYDAARRGRVLAALASRHDPRIGPALVQAIAGGRAGEAELSLLRAQDQAPLRGPLLALVASDDPRVRALALEATRAWRGADVITALDYALTVAPADERAYTILLEHEGPERTGVLARMLVDPQHAPRRVELLRALSSTEDPRVAEAAARLTELDPSLAPHVLPVLERQREAAAVPALARLTADARVPVRERVRAIELVAARAEHEVAVAHLLAVARDPELDVKLAARRGLHALDPSVFPEWDPYGRYPLVAVGAGFGASMLILAHDIADARLSKAFTAGAGLVLGAATPFLLTRGEEVSLGDAAYFASTSAWGTLGGWGLGSSLGLDDRDTRWLTLAGQGLGLTAGALTMGSAEWGLSDALLANTTALEAALTASTLAGLLGDGTAESQRDAALIAGAVTMVPMALLARRLEVRGDLDVVAAAMGHGAWLGSLAPAMLGREGAALEGLVVGQGVGFLAGLALAHTLDVPTELALGSLGGSALGAASLGGLALSLDGTSGQARAALVEAGSIAGVIAAGLLGPRIELHANDGWLIAVGGALGAVAGLRLEERLAASSVDGESLAGNLLLGTSAGALSGLLLSQLVDASDAQLARSLAGGAVLAVGGFGVGRALDGASISTRGLITGGAFLAGVVLTAPLAESLELGTAQLGFASITGAALGLWATELPDWTTADPPLERSLALGAVGTSVGFTGGLALAQVLPVESSDLLFVGSGAVVGSLAGVGASSWLLDASPGVRAGLVQGLGLAGLVGASALALGHQGGPLARADWAPALTLASHGALLAGLWPRARTAGELAGGEVAGGVLLGATLGLSAGVLASELGGLQLDGDVLAETTLLAGAAHLLGVGTGLVASDAQAGAIVMEGLGTAALLGGLWLAPRTTYDAGDAALITTLGLLGGWHGGWLGSPIDAPTGAGGAMIGGSAGVLAGVALAPWLAVDPGDVVELGLITEAAAAVGAGVAASLDDSTATSRALSMSLAGAGGLALGSLWVGTSEYSVEAQALTGVLMGTGAALGARAAPAWSDSWEGAAVAGTGAGLLAGLVVSQALTLDAFDVAEVGLVAGAGQALTAGLELALPTLGDGGRAALATMGGATALVAGLGLAPLTTYGDGDLGLVTAGTALGAWHGFLLSPALGAEDGRARGGAVLAGASVGLLGSMALAQAVEVDSDDLVELGFLTLAGDAVGAGVGLMLDDPAERTTALLASSVGLAALGGALVAAPHTRYSGSDYGLVGLAMGLGAWHGSWAGVGLGGQGTRTGGASLLGVGTGALVGSTLAALTDVSWSDQGEALALWGYGSAIGGGVALASGTESSARTAAFVEAGGLAGLAGAAALSEHTSFSSGDALLVGALGVAGAWHGSTLPALMGDASAEVRGGGALIGAGAFALGGHLVSQLVDYQATDVAEIAVGTLLGNAMGLGLASIIPGADDRVRLALVDGLGLGALGTMMLLAPSIDVDRQVWLDAALLSGLGATLGAALPGMWSGPSLGDVPADAAAGGALLGATLGLGGAVLLGQTTLLDAERRESVALGAFAGALTGSGLGLALAEDDRWAVGLFEGLTVAGALAVGATVDRVELSLGDAALGTTWTAYLAWHQLGLTLLTGGTDRQAAGATLASVGLGTLSGLYLVPRLDLEGEDVLMLFAGSVWGSWLGGWSGAMLRRSSALEGRESTGLLLLASVLGSDLGVGLTSLVLTDVLHVEPTRFAVINLCGLGGMMMGMLGAGFAQEEPLEAGNVIGSLAGLTLGTIVTAFFDFSEAPSPYEEDATPAAARVSSAPTVLSVKEWFPTARVEPGPEGKGERYMIGVVGRWD
jgi:hypothetical protein